MTEVEELKLALAVAQMEVRRLEDRVVDLMDGACRHNCTTRRKSFYAGYDYGMDQFHHWKDREDAYQDWVKREQEARTSP